MGNILGTMGQGSRRLLVPVCAILLMQAAASRVFSIREQTLPLPDLRGLPEQLGGWQLRGEQVLDSTTISYLRPDEYVLREYANGANGASISLFVAYFKSLQDSYGPHSPRVCLPGAGWLVRSTRTSSVGRADGARNVPVNEYIMEKSGNRILVVYWYQNERDVWADEFWAKIRLLPDLVRYHRSDVSLVRLVSPTTPAGDDFTNCLQFASLLVPTLTKHFEAAR